MVIDDLIYDVGVHTGADSEYYLRQGFRVVGIEASPPLAAHLRRRFAREIADCRYVLLEVGIAETRGEARFWLCESEPALSSFDPSYVAAVEEPRNCVRVPTVPLADVVGERGMPFYCKIDVEGSDATCLAAFAPDRKPRFVSIEMSEPNGEVIFETLRTLGYRRFKLMSQLTRAQPAAARIVLKTRFGGRLAHWAMVLERKLRGITSDRGWRFEEHSSGPFGEATPGRWKSCDEVAAAWRRLSRIADDPEWYDVHAAE